MSKENFLKLHKEKLFNFEIEEVKNLKCDTIYFTGQSLKRTNDEFDLFKGPNEDKITKEFDDEEGYYNVLINDHLTYRYEVLKILGKGSFA